MSSLSFNSINCFRSFLTATSEPTSETNQNAQLQVTTNTERISMLSMRNSECIDCKLVDLIQFNKFNNASLAFTTSYPSYFIYLYDRSSGNYYCTDLFSEAFKFGENATYSLKIDYNNQSKTFACKLETLVPGQDIYAPLIISLSTLIGIGALHALAQFIYTKYYLIRLEQRSMNNIVNSDFGETVEDNAESGSARVTKPKSSSSRMKSVDVLRGMCLAIMMFVNFGAGGYSILDHSVWNGLNLADFVFPCFIFIMGISIPLAFKSVANKQGAGIKITSILFRIFKRSLLLFAFGLYTSNNYHTLINGLRIMGVLQRFSISYLVCAMIELFYFRMNNYTYADTTDTEYLRLSDSKILILKNTFKEIILYPVQWLTAMLLTVLWLLLTFLLPVENCPTGYLGPGGLYQNASHSNCTGGAAGLIDRMVLGESHVYHSPTCREIYQTQVPYDPEGLLGCLTSAVLTYLGVATGHIIMHYKNPKHRICKFLVYSVLYGLIAGVLCKFSRDEGWIPVNKNLWSLSFILAIASISLLALVVLYIVIDLAQVYSGTPFLYLGRNSISIYICHGKLSGGVPVVFSKTMHPILLLYSFYWITIWTLLAFIMNKKKVFFSL